MTNYNVTSEAAFRNLVIGLQKAGLSDSQINSAATKFLKGERKRPMQKKEIYKNAYSTVLTQWSVKLIRYGRWLPSELPKLYDEFYDMFRDFAVEHKTPPRAALSIVLDAVWCALKIRGIPDDEIAEYMEKAEKKEGRKRDPETMSGLNDCYDGIESPKVLVSMLDRFSKYGLSDEELKEISAEFRERIGTENKTDKELWKGAFLGLTVQWTIRLGREGGFCMKEFEELYSELADDLERNVRAHRDIKKDLNDTFRAYYSSMLARGIGRESIVMKI